jgi:AraC-like DNA-binding protein
MIGSLVPLSGRFAQYAKLGNRDRSKEENLYMSRNCIVKNNEIGRAWMSNQPVVVQERHRLLVFNVMDYIEEHLNEKLTLHKVAELVSYSPFHFHRLFKGVTGENLNDYVKRTRLERALTKILFHDQSLSEIAIDCGFSSIGDFSRSFKSFFGRNASEFREQSNCQNRKICEMDRKITERYFDTKYYNIINPDGTTRIEAKRSLKVTVKQLPSYSVIYDRCIGRQDSFSDQERPGA